MHEHGPLHGTLGYSLIYSISFFLYILIVAMKMTRSSKKSVHLNCLTLCIWLKVYKQNQLKLSACVAKLACTSMLLCATRGLG